MTKNAWTGRAVALAAALALLMVVQAVHAGGQTLLALVLLVIAALAAWTYLSPRTHALRYLFPGVAAALVFVVFPMLYTVGIGFTNQSSRNLMDRDAARQALLAESVVVPDSARGFTLHAEGARFRVVLEGGLASPPLALDGAAAQRATLQTQGATTPALPLAEVVRRLPALRALTLQSPDGTPLTLLSLREFAHRQPLYESKDGGALADRVTGALYRPDEREGFFTSEGGDRLQPGYIVGVGLRHYASVFSEGRFREPFLSVFVWTVMFSALSVAGAAGLGLLLAVLLEWEGLAGRAGYRLVLFLPYAVPGFISILVFKGLFNQNLGEVNLILNALFGVKPAWFSDPLLARLMLVLVNVWLGFPYMMVLCTGLIKSIPADLYEASAVAGAGPWVNFSRITMPLLVKPLTPLLISAFAFNFNNFVLVSLLTGGRPDQVDSTLPAGTTDILVSYTWRIAFQDSGQQFGLAAAISTVIFLMVAAVTLVQLKYTRITEEEAKG